ncbi:MAG: efflux RND transporter periplasmic adaptor subunit [Caulobacteraceae bacterium]
MIPVSPLTARQRRFALRLSATLSLAALATACGKKPAPPPPPPPQVGVQVVALEPVTQTTELPGRTDPMLSSDVRPQVNGIIKARLFVEGSNVKAGQVLYQIDPAPYQAALDQAKGTLANAQAMVNSTKLQVERYAGLVKINAVSRQDNDNAQASAQQASATVVADKAAVEAAQINLNYTKVTAPISGRIGRSIYTPGALVTSGQTAALATIQKMDPMYVDVAQSSDELLALEAQTSGGVINSAGAGSAKVKLILSNGQAYPGQGELKFSDVTVDQTTNSVTLRALFPNPHNILLPGMFVRAQLVQGVYRQGILAPQIAVTHDPRGEATAMVVGAGNKVESRTLKLGGAYGDKWLVTDGLKAGDKLIVEGGMKAQPGTVVKPTPAQAAPAPAAPKQGAAG